MREYKDEHTIRFEAYDIAHMGGDAMVGVMVVVEGGVRKQSAYRKFHIHQDKSDDTKALKEVLTRRLAHTEWTLPDVIVVDGGTAQKNTALSVLKSYSLTIPVVSVIKDENHKPKRIVGPNKIVAEEKSSILLGNAEAHRFAITFHKKTRGKKWLQSALE